MSVETELMIDTVWHTAFFFFRHGNPGLHSVSLVMSQSLFLCVTEIE